MPAAVAARRSTTSTSFLSKQTEIEVENMKFEKIVLSIVRRLALAFLKCYLLVLRGQLQLRQDIGLPPVAGECRVLKGTIHS